MFWSRLSRKIDLLPHLNNLLRVSPFETRRVTEAFRSAAYYTNGRRAIQRHQPALDSQFILTCRIFKTSSSSLVFGRHYVTQSAREQDSAKLPDMEVLFNDARPKSLQSVEEKIARHTQLGTAPTREIVVQFNADVADGMPWKFIPTQREVKVKPGESALAFYTAENCSSTPITGVSTYSVIPMKFASCYMRKEGQGKLR